MPDYIPTRDGDLYNFAKNMSNQIHADPSLFGFTVLQSDLLKERFDLFAQGMKMIFTPETEGPRATFIKNEARENLVGVIREYVAVMRANRNLSGELLYSVGIKRKKETITRNKRPQSMPAIHVKPATSHSIEITLSIEPGGRPSRPEGAVGAVIFVYYGNQPSENMNEWVYYGNYSKNRFELPLRGTLEYGQQVWITAAWFNPKGEQGNPGKPKTTRILGGPNFSTLRRSLAA